MTKCLLLVTMIIFVISKSAAADEPITKNIKMTWPLPASAMEGYVRTDRSNSQWDR
jgi:hypothetical protein